MASDLSSSENIMDDEKEEGELSLEDVSSSEEGAVYGKYPPRRFGQCPYCLSTKLCATWCRSLTVNNKNNKRDTGLQGKENRANHHRVKDVPEVQQNHKKKKDTELRPVDDLVPISSDSDMEIVGLDENTYVRRKTKSSKIRRKHRKKSPSMLLSPVSQDIALCIKKSIHKLNAMEQLELSKKESTSGHSKHHHSSHSNKVKPKTQPVSKKRSRSPPLTRSRTKKRSEVASPLLKKRSLLTKKSSPVFTKQDHPELPETPSAREKVTKLLKKVRQLEPHSTRISEKSSLKDKLSGIIKNNKHDSKEVTSEETAMKNDKSTKIKDDVVEIEMITKKIDDTPSIRDEESKNKIKVVEKETKEHNEVTVLPLSEECSDTKLENTPVLKPEVTKTPEPAQHSCMPTPSSEMSPPSRPSSQPPSSPLSISPTPPEATETQKLPNFCMDDNDEDLELRLIALRSAVIKKHETRLKKKIEAVKKKFKRQKQQQTPVPELKSPFQSEFHKEFPMLAEICMSPDSPSNLKDDIYCPEDMELDSDMELDNRDSPYSPTDDVVGEITIEKDESLKVNRSLYSPSAPTDTPQFKYFRDLSEKTRLEGSFLELSTHEARPYSPTDVPYYDPELTVVNKSTTESFPVPSVPPPIGVNMYPSHPFMLGCPTNSINPYMEPIPVMAPSSNMASLPINPLYPSLVPSYPMMSITTTNTISTPQQSVPVDLRTPFQQTVPTHQITSSELNIEETDLDGSPLVPEDYKSTSWPPVRGQPMYYENVLESKLSESTLQNKETEAEFQSQVNLFKQPTMKPVKIGNNTVYGSRFRPTKVKPIVERILTTQSAAAFNACDFDDEFDDEMINQHQLVQSPTPFVMETASNLENKLMNERTSPVVVTVTQKKKKLRKRNKLKNSLINIGPVKSVDQNLNKFEKNVMNDVMNESKEKSTDDDEETLRKQLLDSLAKKFKNQSSIPSKTCTHDNKEISQIEKSKNLDGLNPTKNTLLIQKTLPQLSPPISSTIKPIKRSTSAPIEQSVEKIEKRPKIDSSDDLIKDKEIANRENISVSNNSSFKVNDSVPTEDRPESPDAADSQRIVINLNEEPDTETQSNPNEIKSELAIPSAEFEKSVDQFLKNLRLQQESSTSSTLKSSQNDSSATNSLLVSENTESEKPIAIDLKSDLSSIVTPTTKTDDCTSPNANATNLKITCNNINTVSSSIVTTATASTPSITTNAVSASTTITSLNVTITKPKAAFTVSLGPPVAETGARARPASSAAGTDKNKAITTVPRVVKPIVVSKTGVQRPTSCATPQVMKHLPASQQEEYRRLKMKLLERQKLLLQAKESTMAGSLVSSSNAATITSSSIEKIPKTRPAEIVSSFSKQNNSRVIGIPVKNVKALNVKEENKTTETSTSTSVTNTIIIQAGINKKSSVNTKQKLPINNQQGQVKKVEKISSQEVQNSNVLIPKIEKEDSTEVLNHLTPNKNDRSETMETSQEYTSKQTWEDFKRLVNDEVQNLSDLSIEDKKQLLSKTEEELVTKRHSVLDDITEMSTNLRQWEVERDLQNIISIEIKNLREQLRIAEEKFQHQKEKMNIIQPKVSIYHGKINDGRKECFRLSKICHGLGSKIIGPSYKVPTAAAELLNNRIKEVANHTQKLRSKKVVVKKPTEINLKTIPPSKTKIILKKNDNKILDRGGNLVNKNLSVAKETVIDAGKNQSDFLIRKHIKILSPHSINLKAEKQLNNIIYENSQTKESLSNSNISKNPTSNASSNEVEKQFFNSEDSMNNENQQQKFTCTTNSVSRKLKISDQNNENNINNVTPEINFELNSRYISEISTEKSDFNNILSIGEKIDHSTKNKLQESVIILEKGTENSANNFVLNTDSICTINSSKENSFNSVPLKVNALESQNINTSCSSPTNPILMDQKTIELENENRLVDNSNSVPDQIKKTDEILNRREVSDENNSNCKSIETMKDLHVENIEFQAEKQLISSKAPSTQKEKTVESKSENQLIVPNDVSVEVIGSKNLNTKDTESEKEYTAEKKMDNLITPTTISKPNEIIEKPKTSNQYKSIGDESDNINSTPMEIDIEPSTCPLDDQVRNCQFVENMHKITEKNPEILSKDLTQSVSIETPMIFESGTEEELNRVCESVNSNFITSTPNKIIESKTNKHLSEVNSLNSCVIENEKVTNSNQEENFNSSSSNLENPVQINLEDNFTDPNDEKVVSKPASTMLGIKEKILHAENILNQVMLKLSKDSNINTMISHKKSKNSNNNLLSFASNDKNSNTDVSKLSSHNKTPNSMSNSEDFSSNSNNLLNLSYVKTKSSETNNCRADTETSEEVEKGMESDGNFENNCFEVSCDSEHSTLSEEIALLELANAQEVPDKIVYKPNKESFTAEKNSNKSLEDVVKINFPPENIKKAGYQPHQTVFKRGSTNVSRIKIKLPEETSRNYKQVQNSKTRSVSKDLSNISKETATVPQKAIHSLKKNHSSQFVQNFGPIRRKNIPPSDRKTELPIPPPVKKFDRPYESVLRHLNTPRYSKPNGVLCPFQLRGTCNNGDCQFVHQSSHCYKLRD